MKQVIILWFTGANVWYVILEVAELFLKLSHTLVFFHLFFRIRDRITSRMELAQGWKLLKIQQHALVRNYGLRFWSHRHVIMGYWHWRRMGCVTHWNAVFGMLKVLLLLFICLAIIFVQQLNNLSRIWGNGLLRSYLFFLCWWASYWYTVGLFTIIQKISNFLVVYTIQWSSLALVIAYQWDFRVNVTLALHNRHIFLNFPFDLF